MLFWNIWTFFPLVVEDETSLQRPQNPVLYRITSNMNPMHTFITVSLWFPDPLIMLEHTEFSSKVWNPVKTCVDSNKLYCIKQIPVYAMSQKCCLLLRSTEYPMLFLPPFTARNTSFREDIKLWIMQLLPTLYYIISIKVQFSNHTIVKCIQSIFFPLVEKPTFKHK